MSILLGIDTGTTKSACVLLNKADHTLLACVSREHKAGISDGVQDARKHLEVIRELIAELPGELKKNISSVGVTGQMHGVVLWSKEKISPLYTWQSTVKDIAKLRRTAPGLCHGFGCATMAELAAEGKLDGYSFAATVHDFLVWHLTGNTGKPVMDLSDAASWGCFDTAKGSFDMSLWQKLGIPAILVPEIRPVASCAGTTVGGWGLPEGIPVMTAIGDNQASVAVSAETPEEEIFLTLGTGAQLSVVIDRPVDGVECRPYCGGKFLAVAAPLCGGAAWAWLVKTIKDWQKALGREVLPDGEIYDIIDDLACNAMDCSDLPETVPSFLGERSAPDIRGTVSGITLDNFTPGKTAASLALGIIRNLRSTLPEELQRNRKKLLVSGNAVRRTRALQMACTKIFGIRPTVLTNKEEAACGAAILSAGLTAK